jgi:hypothetical protein
MDVLQARLTGMPGFVVDHLGARRHHFLQHARHVQGHVALDADAELRVILRLLEHGVMAQAHLCELAAVERTVAEHAHHHRGRRGVAHQAFVFHSTYSSINS